MKSPIPQDLFNILACPECRGNLFYTKDKKSLYCKHCKLTFPIKGDIPVLLVSQAHKD